MAEVPWLRCPLGPGSLDQCGRISLKSYAIITFLCSCNTLTDELPLSRVDAAAWMCHIYLLHLHTLWLSWNLLRRLKLNSEAGFSLLFWTFFWVYYYAASHIWRPNAVDVLKCPEHTEFRSWCICICIHLFTEYSLSTLYVSDIVLVGSRDTAVLREAYILMGEEDDKYMTCYQVVP